MKEHVDIIVEGLSEHYDSSIAFITNKLELPSLDEIETVLLAHESRIEKFSKKNVISINVASTSSASQISNSNTAQSNFVQQTSNRSQYLTYSQTD